MAAARSFTCKTTNKCYGEGSPPGIWALLTLEHRNEKLLSGTALSQEALREKSSFVVLFLVRKHLTGRYAPFRL